jgi:hypothetical protein
MKLIYIVSTAVLVVYSTGICAQKKGPPVYFKVYGAYGFLSPGSFRGEPPKSATEDTTIFKAGKRGLGEGLRVGAGFGFILSDYINIGLDGEYLMGRTIETSAHAAFGKTNINTTSVYKFSLLSVIPNITFKAVSQPSYHIYFRLGVVIGIPLTMTEDYDYNSTTREGFNFDNFWTRSVTYKAKFELKTGVGYQAALGVQIKITDNLRGFGEISGYCLALNRIRFEETEKTRKVTSPQVVSPEPPDNSRNIVIYKEEGSTIAGAPQGPVNNKVTTWTRPQEPINMNAITAGIGIFYRF